MNEIKLSICIPTYNRDEIVYRTVKNILKCERQDIEVVVSNNCSTDKTEELLSTIKDKRFKYFRNKYNNGADNLISVLTYGIGEYLLLISDEDEVVLNNLDEYISFLKEKKPAVLLGTSALLRKRYINCKNLQVQKGFEALLAYGFGCTYMSGYIYNGKIMRRVLGNIYGTDINRKFGYGYNFTNLARKMLEYGDYMEKEEVITNQREEGRRDMKTHFDKGKMAYSPEYKLTTFEDSVALLKEIHISERQKVDLVALYFRKTILETSMNDFVMTYDKKILLELRNKEEKEILKYYDENKDKNKKLYFYIRLIKNILKVNAVVFNTKIFNESKFIKVVYAKKMLSEIIKSGILTQFPVQKFIIEKYM